MAKKMAVAKIGSKFMALDNKEFNVAELLEANLGGRTMTPWSFDTATFPSGKASVFEVPTLEGTEAVKEIIGICLHWGNARVYYEKDFDEGGGMPPDCNSTDLITGHGNPGVFSKEEAKKEGEGVKAGDSKCPDMKCENCWNARFETAKQGSGQACRERLKIFILQEDNLLPLFMNIPPSSLQPMGKFFIRLTSKGKKFNAVVLKIALVKTKNKSGTEYSEVDITWVRDLTPTEIEQVETYSKAMGKLFD